MEVLVEVYNSWIVPKIGNYNSSLYYESPDYLYASYEEGRPLQAASLPAYSFVSPSMKFSRKRCSPSNTA